MSAAAMTIDTMRRDIAAMIHLDPSEIGDDDNLGDLGLDSMRLMSLVLGWQEAGLNADFGVFAEFYTLGEWWTAVERLRAGAA